MTDPRGTSTAAPSTMLAPVLPRFAQIEPIGRCNLACRMCTVNERRDTVAELSLARFRALLDRLPDLAELHLQGLGEPMLHPQFFDMVELAARRGIRVSANSNLTLLTPARAERCVTSGLAALFVSLDGASAAVYESIRRKASFDKVVRNLDRLVDARDAAASALRVCGVMVLMRVNLDELPGLVRLLHAHRVHELHVQRLANDLRQPDLPAAYIPIRSYLDDTQLDAADLPHARAVFDDTRAVAEQLGVRLDLPRLEPRARDAASSAPRCRWPFDQIYVTAAGELLPCCMVASADRASFGNVFEGESVALEARWHGDAATAFRQALVDDSPPAVCASCALYHGMF